MTMFTRCPNCKSFDVRRSSVRTLAASTRPKLHSPYRCRDCGARFWVISKRAFYLAGVAGITIVAGAVAWNAVGALDESRQRPKAAASDAASFAEAVKLAESKDPAAEYRLAHLYASANSVNGNNKQALAWLERAAEHGNADAQYALGRMYRTGIGVPADNAKAYMWFNLAAAQEVAGAAVQRTAVLHLLSSAQVLEAQAEARRLSDAPTTQPAIAP